MLWIDKYIEVKKETPQDYIKISKQSAQTNKGLSNIIKKKSH